MTFYIEKLTSIRDRYSHRDIVDIISEGFGKKFTSLNLEEPTVKKVINNLCIILWNSNNTIVALKDEKIIGVLVFSTQKEHFNLRKKLFEGISIKESIYLFLFFSVLSYHASKNETYIELIAVSKEFRKQGIGKELINYIKYHNLNKVITLFVSEDNKNALRLYKKQAFTVKRKIKSKFVKKIIGIKGFYFMSY